MATGGKAGSYAISTVSAESWLRAPINQPRGKVRKSKTIKQVLHPIFSECSRITADPFWIDLFTGASYGKMPRNFSYKDNTLIFKRTAKPITTPLPQNPYEAISVCMEFLRRHGGIVSDIDQKVAREEQVARAEMEAALDIKDAGWNDYPKKVREALVELYISDCTQEHNLVAREERQLRHTIKVNVALGYFNGANINVSNRQINKIEGLIFDEESRVFTVDSSLQPKLPRPSRSKEGSTSLDHAAKKDTIPNFSLKWCKYLEEVDKKISRVNKQGTIVSNSVSRPTRLKIVPTTGSDSVGAAETGSWSEDPTSTEDMEST